MLKFFFNCKNKIQYKIYVMKNCFYILLFSVLINHPHFHSLTLIMTQSNMNYFSYNGQDATGMLKTHRC